MSFVPSLFMFSLPACSVFVQSPASRLFHPPAECVWCARCATLEIGRVPRTFLPFPDCTTYVVVTSLRVHLRCRLRAPASSQNGTIGRQWDNIGKMRAPADARPQGQSKRQATVFLACRLPAEHAGRAGQAWSVCRCTAARALLFAAGDADSASTEAM